MQLQLKQEAYGCHYIMAAI